MPRHPLISVIMPCYNTPDPENFLAIESVVGQLYPHWELCIADDASTDPRMRQVLTRYSQQDSRIKVVFRPQNGHIAAASNSALEVASGEFVALLDHDDLLSEHALFWMAQAILDHPHAALFYSDEDKVDEAGWRSDPYFKCSFNLDLFLSHNLITHLGVYKTSLLRQLGGFRPGFDGAQDWDLALRFLDHIGQEQIVHIPRILYHWRMHPASTARSQQAKPYAYVAAQQALNDYFKRNRIAASAEFLADIGAFRPRYALPRPCPLVTLIIPTRNGVNQLRPCLESILKKTDYHPYDILLVDNGSDDPATLAWFAQLSTQPNLHIVRYDAPFNYSAINNFAVNLARGDLLALLNDDTEIIDKDWLTEMVSIALQPGVGAVGARLWYPNDTVQHGGVILGLGGYAAHAHRLFPKNHPGYAGRLMLMQSYSAVTAACLVVSKSAYQQVGGMDEKNLVVAYNDVDFCLRLREAGYRNVWTPFANLYHHESMSRGPENTPEKQVRFQREKEYLDQRWGKLLAEDPAYSPNLTQDREDFSYAWPPRVES
ncbi:MAG: glycosyltransferase family 2 protein [Magnetococcales bacterium]|nr:glycosyltransferase family 2 protein [Magnetococcales bacterium]NGZ28749.1 glycosyltransferase family 2 protein [Magnetococcales bacterium]